MIAPQKSTLIGQPIGKYRIVRELRHSSIGEVYEILQDSIGYRAAVKVLPAQLARDPAHQQYVSRFIDEARAVNFIAHTGIAKIFDLGELADGSLYIMMEYLDGQSLAERERTAPQQRLALANAARITRQIASVMVHVHSKGVLHRDLKPENIFLIVDSEAPGQERVKLVDFGLAKFLDSPDRRTSVGVALGTPTYMAPEQCLGSDNLDGRSDVYSLGVILYEMLAGRPPFSGTQQAVMNGHIRTAPPPLRELSPGLPAAAYHLVDGMLSKSQAERPDMAHVEALATSLEAELRGGPGSPARRPATAAGRRLGAGIGLGVLLVLIGEAGLGWGMRAVLRRAVCAPRPIGESTAAAPDSQPGATPPAAAARAPRSPQPLQPEPSGAAPSGAAATAGGSPEPAEAVHKHPHAGPHKPKAHELQPARGGAVF